MVKEKYYRCPQCGELTTESRILAKIEYTRVGNMCLCEWANRRRLIKYEEITFEEYVAECI